MARLSPIPHCLVFPWPAHQWTRRLVVPRSDLEGLALAHRHRGCCRRDGLRSWPAAGHGRGHVQFLPDGANALCTLANPARPRRLAIFELPAPSADFSPDGQMVVTTSWDDQLVLWTVADTRHPRRIARLATHDRSQIWGEAFSPDGKLLAAAYDDRLFLWNVADPAKPKILRACQPPSASWAVPWRATSRSCPTGTCWPAPVGRKSDVAIWDVGDPAHATRIATISGSAGFINALAFSALRARARGRELHGGREPGRPRGPGLAAAAGHGADAGHGGAQRQEVPRHARPAWPGMS